ncbi:hypothetical protein UY3_17830 [Chelonia mydas]|uniref:Myb/SANT-like DNA-binding domain-containing protein n=1 Tax=Chelonia mydas TaxID=8469 RepID=M7AL13_CHEMY|nr:hypothetical protein UY3_17830 [Chelonia mydas]
MMESQNRKRAPAWTEREVRDLIAGWEEESVLSERRSSFQNAKTFVKISQGMKDRGHNRDPKQCHVKLKELRQASQKTREANGRSGSEAQTCRFYDELHAILGGSAITTPAVLFDSFNGDGGNKEASFGDEEDVDDEVVGVNDHTGARQWGNQTLTVSLTHQQPFPLAKPELGSIESCPGSPGHCGQPRTHTRSCGTDLLHDLGPTLHLAVTHVPTARPDYQEAVPDTVRTAILISVIALGTPLKPAEIRTVTKQL